MSSASIPVDVINPGQVFACMGLLEAADVLDGPAVGGFRWPERNDASYRFELQSATADNPVATVLDFIANAEVTAIAPDGWIAPKAKTADPDLRRTATSSTGEPSETALPIVLEDGSSARIYLTHWADDSSRDAFKLYSGNRSALGIAQSMIHGRTTARGRVQQKGITHLKNELGDEFVTDPFCAITAMGGSFNFDARCAWQSIDAGYSPNDHGQDVQGSPTVELLAALGLEETRPLDVGRRHYAYSIWREMLPPVLARPALSAGLDIIKQRRFAFTLGLSGKNKIVEYAQEEIEQ